VSVWPDKHGEATVTITVKDNGGGDDTTVETFTITVLPVPDIPEVIFHPGIVAIPPGQPVHIDLNDIFSNPDDDDLDFEVMLPGGQPLPGWVDFDPETGIISGTPGDGDTGTFTVIVRVTNEAGDIVETSFTVVVIQPNTSAISGSVVAMDEPVTGGISVILLAVDENNMHTMIASINAGADGSFAFYNLTAGTYLVKAVVTDAEMHPTLFDTWYESELSVLDATAISLGQADTENIQVTMIEGNEAAGDILHQWFRYRQNQ
jgi:hypothetical protein